MVRHSKRTLTALILVLLLSLSCAAPVYAATADAAQITIKVRVFDKTTGDAYEVGTATVNKTSSGIQAEAYTIPALSYFTNGTYTRMLKVVGNWYFPTGDMAPGSIVYFSNNASSATMTYWVENYKPAEQPKPGTPDEPSVTPPTVTEGEVALTVKVVYVSSEDQVVGYGDGKALKLKCQSSYCKHNTNCSILLKDFHPTTLGIGETITQKGLSYKWIGWSKYTANAAPQFGTFYRWKSDTTNVTTPKSATFYLIYKTQDAPASNDTLVTDGITLDGDNDWTILDAMMIMDYLAEKITLTDAQLIIADVDGDGDVTLLDAMKIMDDLANSTV